MLETILHNQIIVSLVMAFVIFLLVQLIKQPIKLLTKKLNDPARKMVNSVILLLPFGLGILGEFLFGHFYLHEPFDVVAGVLVGGHSIAMYGIVERLFGLKINNPYKSGDGAEIVETANEIVKEKKVSMSKIAVLFTKLFKKKEQTVDAEGGESIEPKVDEFESKLKQQLDKIK